jgi:hypothetical protein
MTEAFAWLLPEVGLWSTPSKVAHNLKIRPEQARAIVKSQEAAQRLAAGRPKERVMMPNGGPTDTYQADIVFLDAAYTRANGGYNEILTVINVNTRYVYAVPMKKKSETAEAFTKILAAIKDNGKRIRRLYTDSGKRASNTSWWLQATTTAWRAWTAFTGHCAACSRSGSSLLATRSGSRSCLL